MVSQMYESYYTLFDLNDEEKKGYSKMSGCVFTIKDVVRLVKPVDFKSAMIFALAEDLRGILKKCRCL